MKSLTESHDDLEYITSTENQNNQHSKDKGNKKYHIDAEVGKDPRSGYYIYRVDVQHIPNNGMSQINAYRSYMVSSNFEILKDLL